MNKEQQPALIAFYGFIGSGKSFIAKQLAAKSKAQYISSDRIRVKLFGNKRHSDSDLPKIIDEIQARTNKALSSKKTVVLDANLNTRSARQRAMTTTKKHDANFILVWVDTPIKTIKERLKKRTTHDFPLNLWNDSQETVLNRQLQNTEPPQENFIKIDGTAPFSKQYSYLQPKLKKVA